MKRQSDIKRLEAELLEKDSVIHSLRSELEKSVHRSMELEEVRRAMLFMLEDLNKSSEIITKSQKEWLDTVDTFTDPLFVHDSNYKIIRANKAYAREAGLPFRELIGKPYFEVFPKMKAPLKSCKEAMKRMSEGEEVFRSPSGKIYRIRFFPTVKADGTHHYSTHIIEDVTESTRLEERKRALDDFNQKIITNLDKGYRYGELCKLLISMGYKMVWVGELDNETKEVIPIAEAGFEKGYLSTIEVMFDDSPLGDGPTGRAIKNRRPEILNNIATNPQYKPWREAALQRGYGSSAAFPMITGGKVTGVLNVYSEDNLFHEDDVNFLRDLTNRTAIYIKNTDLFKELSESKDKIREEMDLTSDLLLIAEATSGKTDIDKLMEEVVHCCQRLMKSDISLSYIFDSDALIFNPSKSTGLLHEQTALFMTEHLEKDIWFIRDALTSKKACSVSGPMENRTIPGSDSLSEVPLKWIKDLKKIMVIPLIGRTGPVGMLLSIYMNKKTYTDRDYEIADGISLQVSTALEEARLYKESVDKTLDLSHKIETIRVMHEIDKSILSVLDKNELLESVVRLVGRVVPCDRAITFLVDNKKEGFVYVAGGDMDVSKMQFLPFEETIASEAVKTQRPQILPDLKNMKSILPFESDCIDKGYNSSIRYPLATNGEVSALLCIDSNRIAAFTPDDLSTLEKLGSQIGIALENSRLVSDMEELFLGTVKSLSSAIDAKSPWTAGHSGRVTTYALSIGEALKLAPHEMKDLKLAGLLHDIGKIGVNESILDKPEKLSDDEFIAIKQHPSIGAALLAPIKQLNKNVIPATRHHHERFDGNGYPDGVKGEDIPLMARILAVADTFDAMKADRPYRKGRTLEFMFEEFQRCSGTQFDPAIVTIFLKIITDFIQVEDDEKKEKRTYLSV